ncbi:MAG: hypothetical protein WC861_05255 [Candidatus Micrarchaeia archaeon]|jgi:hypothetical protein
MVEKFERKPEQNEVSEKKPFAKFTGRALVDRLKNTIKERREKRREKVMNLERIVVKKHNVVKMLIMKKIDYDQKVKSRFDEGRFGIMLPDQTDWTNELWQGSFIRIVYRVAKKCGHECTFGWANLHIFEGIVGELEKVKKFGHLSGAARNIQRIIVDCLPKKPTSIVEQIATEQEVARLIHSYGNVDDVHRLIIKLEEASGKPILANAPSITVQISKEADETRELIGVGADAADMAKSCTIQIRELLKEALDLAPVAENSGTSP